MKNKHLSSLLLRRSKRELSDFRPVTVLRKDCLELNLIKLDNLKQKVVNEAEENF